MRALLCRCRCRLEAENDESLRELVRDHLRREHPAAAFDDERVREIVADHSYHYEFVEVYASGSELDEEFGPEPY
jgi:DNA-dependent RNA polymerase auxiliary subunit epsilon